MNPFIQLGHDMMQLWSSYSSQYLHGIWNTIYLAVICTAIGCVIGLMCGILNTIPFSPHDHAVKRFFLKLIRLVIRIYVEVFRGTPMILQAVVIFYGLPYFTNFAMRFDNALTCAFLVVSINTGAYMAESVRGGIMSIDPGQTEGAKAIGMTHWQTMTSVILPQALRNILPQIGNNLIINLKDTSVLSVISVSEFFAVHKTVTGATMLYFPSAAIEMLGYLTMTVIASLLLRWVEKKMEGADNYELTQDDALTLSAGTYRLNKNPEDLAERNLEGGNSHV